MPDKEQKIAQNLERCRENIRKTKGLIEYHKGVLKKQESRKSELSARLEKIKMSALREIINRGGYDIDVIRSAVENGSFNNISAEKSAENTSGITEENTALTVKNIDEEKGEM